MFVLKSTHDRVVKSLQEFNESLIKENCELRAEKIKPNPPITYALDFSKLPVFSIERVDNLTTIAWYVERDVQEWNFHLNLEQHNKLVLAWQSGATGIVVV